MYVCRHEVDVDQGFPRVSVSQDEDHPEPEDVSHWSFSSWTRDTVHLAVAKADKCKAGKLKSNYKNIQEQLLHNQPRSPPPPVIRSHILSLLQCLYFTANYGSSCVITHPTVIPCSRSSAVFFPWHSLHCSPVATLQRRLGEQQ